MGKMKFALHFGITSKTLNLIRQKLFLEDISNSTKILAEIPTAEIIPLYLYTNICVNIL
jgi:hypothetical protein